MWGDFHTLSHCDSVWVSSLLVPADGPLAGGSEVGQEGPHHLKPPSRPCPSAPQQGICCQVVVVMAARTVAWVKGHLARISGGSEHRQSRGNSCCPWAEETRKATGRDVKQVPLLKWRRQGWGG